MFSYFSVNCVFNIIEYFSYLNLWLVILFLFILVFFFVLGSTQLINSSRLCSDVVFETSLVLLCFFLIAIIISPALIILLDLELIIMPSFIIYSCGVQWLWSFSLSYLNWISNCDHYVYSSYLVLNLLDGTKQVELESSLLCQNYTLKSFFKEVCSDVVQRAKHCLALLKRRAFKEVFKELVVFCFNMLVKFSQIKILIPLIEYTASKLIPLLTSFLKWINLSVLNLFKRIELAVLKSSITLKSKKNNKHNKLIKTPFYIFNTNELILLPLLSTIRYYVFSYDVIHSLGIYSFGIKIDAIPGRFNFTSTIRTLIKGDYQGMCYESCGLGHSSTLTIGLVLLKS